jgi:hypothetical protein
MAPPMLALIIIAMEIRFGAEFALDIEDSVMGFEAATAEASDAIDVVLVGEDDAEIPEDDEVAICCNSQYLFQSR